MYMCWLLLVRNRRSYDGLFRLEKDEGWHDVFQDIFHVVCEQHDRLRDVQIVSHFFCLSHFKLLWPWGLDGCHMMIIVSVMWPPPTVQFAFAVKLLGVIDINSTFYMTLANLCWSGNGSSFSSCPQICYATWYFSQHKQSAINTVHHNTQSYKTNQV